MPISVVLIFKSLSRVWLFVTPWTVAYQAPQPMEFSRQEYWSGLSFPPPWDLPDPGIKARSPALQADALPSEPPGKLKAEEPEIKLPTSAGPSKKQENSRKTSISALLTMPKPLAVWITINCRKFLKRREYQTTWPASWEICMQVRKQQLELDMKQQTGSKQEKEYVKAVYSHRTYLTSMQSTSWETLGWKKHKLESRLLGEISITSDMQMTQPLW